MKIMKKIFIPFIILFATSFSLFADDSNSFWDIITTPISKTKASIDKTIKAVEDNVSDIIATDKIDEILYDLSEKIDIDTKEHEMVDSIKDTFPDSIFTDAAAFAVQSASDITRASLITDKELNEIAVEDIKKMDDNQTIAKDIDQYYVDLLHIMKKTTAPEDVKLDAKVYLNPFLYIFTRANGSIRVNSGIIEALTDDQILFLLAHEIAHIKNGDYKGSYRKAHSMFALEKALNMSGSITGSASNGVLESVTSSMRKSRFQKDEEFAADEYAIKVLKRHGIKKKIAIDALEYLQYMNAPLLKLHPTGHERIKHIEDDL
jgi:putative metalloprotease